LDYTLFIDSTMTPSSVFPRVTVQRTSYFSHPKWFVDVSFFSFSWTNSRFSLLLFPPVCGSNCRHFFFFFLQEIMLLRPRGRGRGLFSLFLPPHRSAALLVVVPFSSPALFDEPFFLFVLSLGILQFTFLSDRSIPYALAPSSS